MSATAYRLRYLLIEAVCMTRHNAAGLAIDIVSVAAVFSWALLSGATSNIIGTIVALISVGAAFLARRHPLTAFACSLPAYTLTAATLATLLALLHVGRRSTSLRLPVLCLAVAFLSAQAWRALLTTGEPITSATLQAALWIALTTGTHTLLPLALGWSMGLTVRLQKSKSQLVALHQEANERALTIALRNDRLLTAQLIHDQLSARLCELLFNTPANSPEVQSSVRDLLTTTQLVIDMTLTQPGAPVIHSVPDFFSAQTRKMNVPGVLHDERCRELNCVEQQLLVALIRETASNAARHAPGASLHMRIAAADGEAMRVFVAVDAPLHPPRHPHGTGRGLSLMRRLSEASGYRLATHESPANHFRLELIPQAPHNRKST